MEQIATPFEPTNLKYGDALDAYEAQVEQVRRARILKFKIKWMETSIQNTQMQLQEMNPEFLLEGWSAEENADALMSDPELAIVMGEQE